MSASERAASLRDEYARLGENVNHLSDIDLLNREVERWANESRRHENAYNSLLQDQVKHDQSVYAAARRAAAEDRIAWAGMYLGHLVAQSAHSINAVIHRAAELPDGRVPVEQARELKSAAERAKWAMSGLVGHRQGQLEEARRQNPEISLVEKQREEILRLRGFITDLGQSFHAERGVTGRGRCECSGCELIRAMDDVPAEQTITSTLSAATAA
ncbi:hypothetical protein [Streptomyces ambofaciens]|nr:hypothetical protein [Streptomyces ambofaciens]